MTDYKSAWDTSYDNADNFIFYPDYNVVQFVAKYIKRRVGLDKYQVHRNLSTALDLGCGIGTNMMFLDDYGFDAYGIDLSDHALDFARERMRGGGYLAENSFRRALISCLSTTANSILSFLTVF